MTWMVFCQTCHSYGFLIGIPNTMVTICRSSPSPYDVKSEAHSYQGDFLEIALQNLTQIPDVA